MQIKLFRISDRFQNFSVVKSVNFAENLNYHPYLVETHPYLVETFLTLKDPFISKSCVEMKIELNFYCHTSSWCLKRFYEGL